ncbi:MAG: hypothetical protein HYU36_11900, partial [Planctomycetes bacterium]|nr:hypothetical protein [Planctomycetota bacterium]
MSLVALHDFLFSPATARAALLASVAVLGLEALLIAFCLWRARRSASHPSGEHPLGRRLSRIQAWAIGIHGGQKWIVAAGLVAAATALRWGTSERVPGPWTLGALCAFLALAHFLILSSLLHHPSLRDTLGRIGSTSMGSPSVSPTLPDQIEALRACEGRAEAPGLYPILYQSMLLRLQNLRLSEALPLRKRDVIKVAAAATTLAVPLILVLGQAASLLQETVGDLMAEAPGWVRPTPEAPEETPESLLAQKPPQPTPRPPSPSPETKPDPSSNGSPGRSRPEPQTERSGSTPRERSAPSESASSSTSERATASSGRSPSGHDSREAGEHQPSGGQHSPGGRTGGGGQPQRTREPPVKRGPAETPPGEQESGEPEAQPGPSEAPGEQPGEGEQVQGSGEQEAGSAKQPGEQPGEGGQVQGSGEQEAGSAKQPGEQPGEGEQVEGSGEQEAGSAKQPGEQPGPAEQVQGSGEQGAG